MIWLTSLLLLCISTTLLWFNRPISEWSGAAAARFAAALISAIYAVLAPWPNNALHSSQLLLEQLSLYAALPLLLSVALATHLGYDWSRMIWGRVLLAWCVVFELCRSNNVLDTLLLVLMVLGVGIFCLFWLQPKQQSRLRALLLSCAWLIVTALTVTSAISSSVLLLLCFLLLFIYSHTDNNAICRTNTL